MSTLSCDSQFSINKESRQGNVLEVFKSPDQNVSYQVLHNMKYTFCIIQ